ncbi:VTS1 [Coprinopsis cinerea okayama7|uniref:RNA-binding protein VTS1 n=1 Tax=Coprinopsis cinerea (strain Okayama-7 / 130 / ATCC MYA-4618 / FGSC 9003) TaxID=240176 RepID=A8NS41_COPC7|nr:VTS1 [Coprinopsis cinerea okayama7\|eukprot:XP_001835932.2 VTS1 [Coprinopsis cinerea okayama7\
MSLRPPSTSPSPSPGPQDAKISARQSMGPSARGTPTLAPASPRPGGQGSARPTSELLGSGSMFQTPEAEALDQWFENLQNYEATLEDMAAASLDVNFKEELSAIEQWFKVLSEAERTAALYSLLQHSTQVQIRFFITVLQQMARSDPMTALLSPAMGSMQSQMEAKLATLKSPGLKSPLPASPTARNFNPGNRQSLALDNNSNFLSPDSAANANSNNNNDAAATLAQQRAKLKASNAAHRISAPVLASSGSDARASWGPSQLSQVSEQQGPTQEIIINPSRPKSSDFSGTIASPRPGESNQSESWASMVSTPHLTMFPKPAEPPKVESHWSRNPAPSVPKMGDPTTRRRNKVNNDGNNQPGSNTGVYDDNGNPIGGQGGNNRNVSGGWGSRSPALSTNSSNRFGGNDDNNGMNGLGMQMNGFGVGLSSPTLGMGLPGLGVPPLSPFNMNMGMLSAMGMTPEAQAQLLAAQMAATGFGQPNWLGMQPMSAGLGNQRRNMSGGRSPGLKSASSVGSRADSGTPKAEEDVNPELLNDIPAWLRSLRLHKYTPNFEGCTWKEMVVMDEAQLEAKGVAALGARRKMLKTFEMVRKKMGIEGGPPPSAPPSAAPSVKSP